MERASGSEDESGSRGGLFDLPDLYRQKRSEMVRMARMLTGSMDVAEEVVQDAFLKLHEREPKLDNPEAYLRTMVTNLCRNHLKRVGIARQIPHERRLVLEPEVDDLWQMICQLPFRQRAVLALRFYDDLAESEIAAILGCRVGTVKSSLHRALTALRKSLS